MLKTEELRELLRLHQKHLAAYRRIDGGDPDKRMAYIAQVESDILDIERELARRTH